jgi:hypothetical protein
MARQLRIIRNNDSLRPASPDSAPLLGCAAMNARGSRVRHRVNRAFVALGDQLVATGTLVRMVWPRRSWFRPWHYQRANVPLWSLALRWSVTSGAVASAGRPAGCFGGSNRIAAEPPTEGRLDSEEIISIT